MQDLRRDECTGSIARNSAAGFGLNWGPPSSREKGEPFMSIVDSHLPSLEGSELGMLT